MRSKLRLFSILALLALPACGGAAATPAEKVPETPKPKSEASAPSKNTAADAGASNATASSAIEGGSAANSAKDGSKEGGGNVFTMKMLTHAGAKKSDNVMISGLSLRHALGAVYLGARGETAREMAQALSLPEDVVGEAKAEIAAFEAAKGKNAELSIASRLWVDKTLPIKADYVKRVEGAFGAAPSNVEFAKPEDARKTINAWVSQKTQSKIPELLPRGSVEAKTRLIVTNAVWFKGRWANPFPKEATKNGPFKTAAGKTVTVPTMHHTDSFRFAQTGGVKVLDLGYDGAELSMLLVLPDDPAGLPKLEEKLTADDLEKWTAALGTTRVNVALPRFTFRFGGPMRAKLEELGMKTAFTTKADFQGIVDTKTTDPLEISEVFHQTWIAVDELGTEAAAATGAVMRVTSLPTGPVAEFKADRPFLFFVRGKGRILFAGRVGDPKSGS